MRMTDQCLNKYLNNISPNICEDDKQKWVIAVLITEKHFRNRIQRFLEYIFWPLLFFVWKERVLHLSVGIAQVQLRHWKELGYIKDIIPSIINYKVILSYNDNIHVIYNYLEKFNKYSKWTAYNISTCYNGEARKYYIKVLEDIFSRIIVYTN